MTCLFGVLHVCWWCVPTLARAHTHSLTHKKTPIHTNKNTDGVFCCQFPATAARNWETAFDNLPPPANGTC